jgi:tRNA pseudouridine38-40 synthase
VHRVAIKIAYDGSAFHGQVRQPGLRTVEGEVIHALRRARILRDPKEAMFQSASRTDRGVSALGNVVAFDTSLAPDAAARALNAKSRGVWAWAAAGVPADFNARQARSRWYRYVLPPTHSVDALDAALQLFEGEHDVRNFTRDRARTRLRIDLARAEKENDHVAIDFKAQSFRWNLVRRIVAAALRVESGDASASDIEAALAKHARVDFGLAPPEPLTLMDVEYDERFEALRDPTTVQRVVETLASVRRNADFFARLHGKFADI